MRGSHYTPEQNRFILEHSSMRLEVLADAFYNQFGKTISAAALGKKRRALGLPPLPLSNESMFTDEADQFLRENYTKMTSREMAEKCRELFGIAPKKQTVTERLIKLGIRRGNCYTPKGYVPRASKPIGYERIDKNRTVMVKVEQPDKWMPKALLVMGHDPQKEQVIFLDGNSLNVVPENMLVVSKRIHARLAKNGWLNSSGEIMMTGIKWTELFYAIKELEDENG